MFPDHGNDWKLDWLNFFDLDYKPIRSSIIKKLKYEGCNKFETLKVSLKIYQ